MSSDSSTHIKYYGYLPSLAAACIFVVLFGASTVWHSVLIYKHRTWYFIPLFMGGIFEIVGYISRAVSNKQMPNLTIGPYVVQTLLLLVAPALIAASIYMILGRIIASVDGESYSLIRKRWLTKVFVTSDVVTFFIQLGGAALLASSHASQSKIGSHIVLAGLLLQIIIFGFFVVVLFVFHRRIRAAPTSQCHDTSLPWNRFLYILYVTCLFVMIRSIVRVAEFIEGFQGVILKHGVFLYVFDAVPMLAVIVIFNIWYPSNFSKREKNSLEYRETSGLDVELEGQAGSKSS
ncbi:hypothetical protein V495_02257 [Pseudogymnoascus sp. VKM F-4514 (FW-929)]|nr:hypothetical protein V495_02257 [Pseudogymnoascus sp. VKM F-4514 (FW-929)]KFY60308.1 hypothetical protein V497_03725 [Pseudogymnoascus sp. VKM F-4516 (FW-969)]